MKRIILPIFSISIITLFYFQNCANDTSVLILESTAPEKEVVMPPLPLTHPDTKPVRQTEIKYQIVNRGYVEALIKDIFGPIDGKPLSDQAQTILDRWVVNRGGQYGQGCDLYESHTGRDCRFQEDQSNGPVFTDHSTIRESYQIQFCHSITSINDALKNALLRINSDNIAPNRDSIVRAYDLFYRGEPPTANTINTLLDLDRSLTQNKETIQNRWRMIILMICESPGWQLF